MSADPLVVHTDGPDQTKALAAALAGIAEAGDIVVLAGEMGAGKTAFTQGFAAGLGIDAQVTSPTFTIIQEYPPGRLALHHLDVYRLDHLHEVRDLGLGEMLDEEAVMLVEWGDAVLPVLGDRYLEVRLTFGPGDDDRRLELRCRGASWSARRRRIAELVAPWAGEGGEPC